MTKKFLDHAPFGVDRKGVRPLQANNGPVAHSFDHLHPMKCSEGTGLGRESTKCKGGIVNIHDGMTDHQVNGFQTGGIGKPFASAPDASSANPLDKTAPGKTFATPQLAASNMRSRTSDTLHSGKAGENHARAAGKGVDFLLGNRILNEAFAASSAHDRIAHGRSAFPKKD